MPTQRSPHRPEGRSAIYTLRLFLGLTFALLFVSGCRPIQAPSPDQTLSAPTGLRPDAPPYAMHGPFWVGYRPIVIGSGTERRLDADLWYPALNPEGKPEEIAYEFTPQITDSQSDGPAVVFGHALLDAPIDDAMGPYPLVVFSHSFGGNPEWFSTLTEHLASHGFVVLAAEHVEHDWFENTAATVSRPLDVKRALDYAEKITAPGGDLAGLIDMGNVAVVGHSYGGYTALAMAGAQFDLDALTERCAALAEDDPSTFLCQPVIGKEETLADGFGLDGVPEGLWPPVGDPRVTAIVSMAGDSYMFGEAGLSKITIPMLAIGGTADIGTPYDWGVKPTFDFASSERKALVAINGAEHMIAGNLCEDMPFLSDSPFYGFICIDPVWDKARALDLINHFTTAFLLDTLKGDVAAHAALLPDAVQFPGIDYASTLE